MTAEEFYNTERPDNNDDYQLTKDTEYWYFGKDEMIVFAEAYHKHKVEAITDDNILKGANQQDSFKEKLAWGDGAKWFKNKLLKQ